MASHTGAVLKAKSNTTSNDENVIAIGTLESFIISILNEISGFSLYNVRVFLEGEIGKGSIKGSNTNKATATSTSVSFYFVIVLFTVYISKHIATMAFFH